MTDAVVWFRYREGIVGESKRVAHAARTGAAHDLVASWCERKFDPEHVEEVAEPGKPPQPGQAWSGAQCMPCMLRVLMATPTRISEIER